MIFQAFVDESGKGDIFSMAGYVATVERWAAFSGEWERKLKRFGTVNAKGQYQFHMTEMMANKEREARIQTFYRTIEDHVAFGFGVSLRVSDLATVQKNFRWNGAPVDFGSLAKPYQFTLRFLLEQFHNNRDEPEMMKYLPLENSVDFIFDDQTGEKRTILNSWDAFISHRSEEVRGKYGSKPRFESDLKFLPLQAADFAAWYARLYHRRGGLGYFARKGGSGEVRATKPLLYACRALDIQTISEICEDMARSL